MDEMELERKRLESLIDSAIFSIKCDLEDLEDDFAAYQELRKENKVEYVNVYELIKKMKEENLYTAEIEEFFDNYLKFYNK